MNFVDVTIRPPPSMRHPLVQLLASDDRVLREELLTWHTVDAGALEHQLMLVTGELAVYQEALESLDSIRSYDLTPIDDRHFYAYLEDDRSGGDEAWRAALVGHDFVHVPPLVFEGVVARMTLVGDPDELRAVLAALPTAVTVDVERVGEFRRPYGALTGELTDRQHEALATAFELGYFEVPREASLAEVADALGCTESTASTHLRKAERALVDATLGL